MIPNRHCCENFNEVHEDVVYSSIFEKNGDAWYIMVRPEFDCGACDWEPMRFCPFCGKEK